ncbi:MAG: hypothetical protein FJ146_14075 [Deltaproteobacteria bacterium]|nr:hypothetical protein [Deltaproteobacteria bacterium]
MTPALGQIAAATPTTAPVTAPVQGIPLGGGGASAGKSMAAGLPHGIRGPIGIPMPWWQILLIVAITLAVLAASWALWKWWQRYQARRPKAPRDPWDVLQERLALMQPPVPFTKQAGEDYFAQLSLILREAIERRTQIPATDRTCQELRVPLRSKLPMDAATVEALLVFLDRADFIKFAKAPTDTAEAMSAHTHVQTWLRALVPPPVDGSAAGGSNHATG